MSTNCRNRELRMLVALVAVCAVMGAGAARAATITYAGGVWNNAGSEISQWRTAATPKSLDSDGNNVYGSDAKLFYRVMGDYGTYVQYITSQLQVGPYSGYAVVDHPDGVSADRQVCTTTSNPVPVGSVQNMFTFAVPAAPPKGGFRVGVAFDGLDGAQYSPSEVRLTQTTGGTASASVSVEPYRNNTLDMVFFDVIGAKVGDRFTVQGIAGPGGFATHQIVTWDRIPLPSARLAVGNAIKLDFSTAGNADGGDMSDWNQVGATGSNFPAGTVIRHGDGRPLEGVTISLNNYINGRVNNDGASGNWPGTSTDPYYVLGADDIYFHGASNDLEVVFGGLDPGMAYSLRLYSLINNNGGFVDRFVVQDAAGPHTIQLTRSARWNAATLEDAGMVFDDLRADLNGEIRFRVEDVSNPYYPLNAVVLVATTEIPEPMTLVLLSAAACGLGGYMRRRRS